MRRILAAFVVAAAFASAAVAADKGAGDPAPTVNVELRSPHSGLYVAALAGAGMGQIKNDFGGSLSQEGVAGGLAIGYQVAVQGLVIGLEADAMLTNIRGSQGPDGFEVRADNKLLYSLRSRVGLPIRSAMIYATLGIASTNQHVADKAAGASDTKRPFGWVAGAGVELPVLTNMHARLEALRYTWPEQTYAVGAPVDLGANSTVVRAGLVFKLN